MNYELQENSVRAAESLVLYAARNLLYGQQMRSRFTWLTAIWLAGASILTPQWAHAGDLDKANDMISSKDAAPTRSPRSESRTRVQKKDDDSSAVDDAWLEVALYVFTFPWWGPYLLVEGEDTPSPVGYRDYPYQGESLGHVVYMDDLDFDFARYSAGHISLGVGYMGNDGWRAAARARWMHNSRFEFDVGTIGFGEFDDGEIDAATFFSGHVGYRFVETDTFTMHTGIGGAAWQSAGLWAGGIDLYYGFDWFLVEPIVFSLNAEIGGLGEAARFGFQGSIGAMLGRTEIFLGWEHFVLAREAQAIELGGPQVGVRLWL